MKDIIIKKADKNILKELESIGFDNSYKYSAKEKYHGYAYKLFNLRAPEANILKQLCLSLGFDCAVNRNTITCKCEYTSAVIFASVSQIKALIGKLNSQPFRLKETAEKLSAAINNTIEPLIIRNYIFDWSRPYISGILNVTPDSFSDGGKYLAVKDAVNHALKMAEDGADMLDIGGESTRPGACPTDEKTEISRVIPVINEIRKVSDIPISIDTRNYKTAKSAIEAGADIINDVSGLKHDINLRDYIIKNSLPVILMHSNTVPAQDNDFQNTDITEQIYLDLYEKIEELTALGLPKSKIIADTGIGFGKSKESCYEILKRHEEFSSLGVAMMLGISRKSFIRNEFNHTSEQSDIPTAIYCAFAKGVNIHRVHNVELVKKYLSYAHKIC